MTVALKALQQLLARMGPQVAAGLANQLYVDLTQMYTHRSAYAPDDIYAWIDRMAVELDAFRGRMEAMSAAAIDKRGFQGLVTKAPARGLKPRVNRSLAMGPSGRPGAWSLLLERI